MDPAPRCVLDHAVEGEPRTQRPLLKIVVLNSKGGCGKTTLSTNLAAYYAARGYYTALLDTDPQGSSLRWLRTGRTTSAIHGVTGCDKQRPHDQELPMRVRRIPSA